MKQLRYNVIGFAGDTETTIACYCHRGAAERCAEREDEQYQYGTAIEDIRTGLWCYDVAKGEWEPRKEWGVHECTTHFTPVEHFDGDW